MTIENLLLRKRGMKAFLEPSGLLAAFCKDEHYITGKDAHILEWNVIFDGCAVNKSLVRYRRKLIFKKFQCTDIGQKIHHLIFV